MEVNVYYYWQLGKDSRLSAGTGTGNEGRAFGIGPQLRVGLPGGSTIVAKWQHEMAVRNRFESDRFWLQVLIPLGAIKTYASSNEGNVVGQPIIVARS